LTNTYIEGEGDYLLGKFLLPVNSACITHETLKANLGSSLNNLWVRSRTFASGLEYSVYPEDVPMFYDRDIYDVDPVTGSIFTLDSNSEMVYNILHHFGDPVLDDTNNQVYKHRKGDAMLDISGKPIINTELSTDKEIDLLFVDGKYYFTNDSIYLNYRKEIVGVINNWITNQLSNIQTKLLEKTKIFFYPKTTLGLVKVLTEDATEKFITSEQSLIVDLFVRNSVYLNDSLKQNLINTTITLLDSYIDNNIVNITEIIVALKALYGNSVTAVNVTNLGAENDFKVITIANEHNRLCLRKKLVLQQDNTLVIKEDVNINFYNMEKAI
jgi:hypothetical protein